MNMHIYIWLKSQALILYYWEDFQLCSYAKMLQHHLHLRGSHSTTPTLRRHRQSAVGRDRLKPSRSLRHVQLRLATCTYSQQQQISLPINYERHWVLCLIEPCKDTCTCIHVTVPSPLWYLTVRGLCTLQVLFL